MFEFKLPDLGEGVHEGELLKWYVSVGDVVAEDAPLVDVETDKAAVTIPSPRGGKVIQVNGNVGDTVHVGEVIVVIDDGGAEAPTSSPAEASAVAPDGAMADRPSGAKAGGPAPSPEPVPAPAAAPTAPVAAPSGSRRSVAAAPATRRHARELGVEIALVPGSGPGGRITIEDVRAFASAAQPAEAPAEARVQRAKEGQTAGAATEPPITTPTGASPIPLLDLDPLPDFSEFGPIEKEQLRSIRRKVARKMVTSMVLVPHVAHMDEADVTDLEAARRAEKARHQAAGGDLKLTMLGFVMKAVAAALRRYPSFNASLDPFRGELIYKKYYNLGFAADTDRGLVVPVLKAVDRKNLLEISAEIATLAAAAREGTIGVEDYRGGTFTVTNVGSLGGTGMIPTINYPEVAILGMGKMQDKPVVRDGEVVIRKMLPLTLAFDHRMADGADAARFMNEIVEALSAPMAMLMKL